MPFIRGDVDANGKLEMADAVRTFGFLFLGTPRVLSCKNAADANDSGAVDLSDGVYILAHRFLGGPAPPAPFPDCGADSTDDSLDCRAHAFCPVPFCEMTSIQSAKIDVGGHTLWMRVQGQGCPGIVVEAGSGDTGSGSWSDVSGGATVSTQLAAISRTLVYDRAGLGLSQAGPTPRTSLEIATELHTLLQNAVFEPPYVLVSHSRGADYMRVFANHYSDEVVGMVFVEPAHEYFFKNFKDLYPAEWDVWLQFVEATIASDPRPGVKPETEAIIQETLFTGPGPFPDVPVVVLTGLNFGWFVEGVLPIEFAQVLAPLWDEGHEKLAHSVTNGTHIRVEGVGHFIHLERIQPVLDAIRQVVDGAR